MQIGQPLHSILFLSNLQVERDVDSKKQFDLSLYQYVLWHLEINFDKTSLKHIPFPFRMEGSRKIGGIEKQNKVQPLPTLLTKPEASFVRSIHNTHRQLQLRSKEEHQLHSIHPNHEVWYDRKPQTRPLILLP